MLSPDRRKLKKHPDPKRNKGTWTIRRATGVGVNTAEVVVSCPRCGWVGTFLDGLGGTFKLVTDEGLVMGNLTCSQPECGMVCSLELEGWNPRNDWK